LTFQPKPANFETGKRRKIGARLPLGKAGIACVFLAGLAGPEVDMIYLLRRRILTIF
jgi:DNA-binding IclR family transcriptional regulator